MYVVFKGWLLGLPYYNDGCVKSGSVPTLENKALQLDGDYKKRKDPTHKCYEAANERGWMAFTVSKDGACNSGPDAIYTYLAKGSVACKTYQGELQGDRAFIIHGKQLVSYLVSHITVWWYFSTLWPKPETLLFSFHKSCLELESCQFEHEK